MCIEDVNSLIEIFKKYRNDQCCNRCRTNLNSIITCLNDVDLNNANTLIAACKLLHKEKREACALLEKDANNEELKTFGRLCAIADRSCYQLLKEKHNIVRTVSSQNNKCDFCKY